MTRSGRTGWSNGWVTAITVTPMLCAMLLKPDPDGGGDEDAYSGKGFQMFRSTLKGAIRGKYLTLGVAIALFGAGVWGFTQVKQGFFPFASTPIFFVDVWEVEGTDIRQTRDDTLRLSAYIRSLEGVEKTSTVVGQGLTRFTLVYEPESPFSSYAQILVRTENLDQIPVLKDKIQAFLDEGMGTDDDIHLTVQNAVRDLFLFLLGLES